MIDTRLRLGIDVDGVLSEFTFRYREICEELTGKVLPIEVNDWDFSNWGLTLADHKRAWDLIAGTFNFYSQLPVDDDIRNFDMAFFSRIHRLYFITTRAVTSGLPIELQTAYWLQLHCGISMPTILVEKQKGQIVAALQLDAMLDDKPENLIECSIHSPKTLLFLRNRKYNQDAAEKIKVPFTRVYSFQEFSDAMDKLAVDKQA